MSERNIPSYTYDYKIISKNTGLRNSEFLRRKDGNFLTCIIEGRENKPVHYTVGGSNKDAHWQEGYDQYSRGYPPVKLSLQCEEVAHHNRNNPDSNGRENDRQIKLISAQYKHDNYCGYNPW